MTCIIIIWEQLNLSSDNNEKWRIEIFSFFKFTNSSNFQFILYIITVVMEITFEFLFFLNFFHFLLFSSFRAHTMSVFAAVDDTPAPLKVLRWWIFKISVWTAKQQTTSRRYWANLKNHLNASRLSRHSEAEAAPPSCERHWTTMRCGKRKLSLWRIIKSHHPRNDLSSLPGSFGIPCFSPSLKRKIFFHSFFRFPVRRISNPSAPLRMFLLCVLENYEFSSSTRINKKKTHTTQRKQSRSCDWDTVRSVPYIYA